MEEGNKNASEICVRLGKGMALFADTCFGGVSMSLAKDGEVLACEHSEGQAMESVFSLARSVLEKCGAEISQISAFALCAGVGGVLGIRTLSAALSTLAALNEGAEIFTWRMFDAAALKAREICGGDDFYIVAPSRKNFLNVAWTADGSLRSEEIETLEFARRFSGDKRRCFFIQQRAADGGRPEFLADAENLKVETDEIFRWAMAGALALEPCGMPPDALLLSKREYAKWNSQART